MRCNPQTSPPRWGTTAVPNSLGEIDDPQAGGDATTPRDIRLPDIQGFSTCDVSEAMVTELVLTSSDVYFTDDLPQRGLCLQIVWCQHILKPVNVERGQFSAHRFRENTVSGHIRVDHQLAV